MAPMRVLFRVEKISDDFLDGLGQSFGADVPVLSENGVKLSDVEVASLLLLFF